MNRHNTPTVRGRTPPFAEIRAITVDLDDTLWPVEPVIEAAEHRLYDWLGANCPRVTRSHTLETMRQARMTAVRAHKDIAHDLTEVRRRSLEQLIVAEGGYAADYVDRAMAVFLEHRNQVEFFPDALPFLERASARLPLLGISNGNADLRRIGVSEVFVRHLTAIEVGAAKPDPRMFRAACDYLDMPPERVLHIGDDPIQDILGAARVGMKTVWINRSQARWDAEHSADHEVTSLEQVLELLPLSDSGETE